MNIRKKTATLELWLLCALIIAAVVFLAQHSQAHAETEPVLTHADVERLIRAIEQNAEATREIARAIHDARRD